MKALVRAFAGLAMLAPAFAQYSSPVRDVDNPARQPFTLLASLLVTNGNTAGQTVLSTVPAGKRLVVETVSFFATVPVGQLGLLTIGQGDPLQTGHFLPAVKMVTFGNNGSDGIGNTVSLRMYVDPGGKLSAQFTRGIASGDLQVTVSVSGYYVNVP